ncbi:MAG: DUF6249 domain-containing protein [Candidatus Krumholzibacteriia bacterium]
MGDNVIWATIPLLFIFGGVAIAIVAVIMSGRRKELKHQERLVAMEKGIELPGAPKKERRATYRSHRTRGLVMLAGGLMLTIALWVTAGAEGGVWGLVPLGIGLALLVSSAMERREGPNGNGS